MCVYDVCEVQVAGGVVGFVCNAEIEEPYPHGKLLLNTFVLQERAIHEILPTNIFTAIIQCNIKCALRHKRMFLQVRKLTFSKHIPVLT